MLKQRFLELMKKYSEDEIYNKKCWKEIEEYYTSKSRYYHNLDHLTNLFIEIDEVKDQITDIDSLSFVVYYHDIIYKPTKSDNEHQSALVLKESLSKTSFSNINKCMTIIEHTKEHQLTKDKDTNLLLDMDLSILGQKKEVYIEYINNIRKEYKIYPDFMYHKGRKKVLKNLLSTNSIYKTTHFKKKYEKQAKENLRFELARLES